MVKIENNKDQTTTSLRNVAAIGTKNVPDSLTHHMPDSSHGYKK